MMLVCQGLENKSALKWLRGGFCVFEDDRDSSLRGVEGASSPQPDRKLNVGPHISIGTDPPKIFIADP